MRKRKWHYVMKPYQYEMKCDICDGQNIEWSEYEGKIWCYDCQIDTDGFSGVFGGAIGWGVAQLIGISFDRWNMVKNRVEYARISSGKVKWFAKPAKENMFKKV